MGQPMLHLKEYLHNCFPKFHNFEILMGTNEANAACAMCPCDEWGAAAAANVDAAAAAAAAAAVCVCVCVCVV